MKTAIKIFIIFFLVGCSSSKDFYEVRMPFKNYAENPSFFIPMQNISSKAIMRFWIFESTSIDRVVCIFQDEESVYHTEIIEFGKIHSGKAEKMICQKNKIEPKNGYDNFFKSLKNLKVQNLESFENLEIGYDEHFLKYIIEINQEQYNNFTIVIPASEANNKSQYSEIIKLIKSEYGIK